MASRAEKVRRRRHRKDKQRQHARPSGSGAMSPAPFDLGLPDHVVIKNPPGQAKMSEALLALVEPELERCQNKEAMEKLLTLGMVAWNAALFRGEKRAELLSEAAEALPPEVQADFFELVETFIRRKEELFPNNKRPMLSFHMEWRSGGPYVEVLSGLA